MVLVLVLVLVLLDLRYFVVDVIAVLATVLGMVVNVGLAVVSPSSDKIVDDVIF